MIWTTILKYWKAVLGLLLPLLGFLAGSSFRQKRQLKKEAEKNKRMYEAAVEIAETDILIAREHDTRTEDLAAEIEEKKTSSELSDPNNW